MNLKDKIKELSKAYLSEFIDIRRHIHKYPELSFEEEKTSEFITKKLDEFGIKYKKGYAKYGVLGIIKGEKSGKTIALRADMDALPINEASGLEFESVNTGKMHACGHDIHTTCLLGAAKVLNELRNEIEGTVLLIFQPGEEKIPGGAKLMMEDGLFDEYKPDIIIGQHVFPELKSGSIGFKVGNYMASSDEIYITCKGKGGHAALPHKTVDTVLMASQTVVALQSIISRFVPTQIPAVLSIGNIVCNSVMNVIPEKVELQGTFRIMNEEYRSKVHKKIEETAKHTALSMGGSAEVLIKKGFPCLYNNPELTQQAINYGKDFLEAKNVADLDIRMTAEDFGWFAQKYPAVFYRLGVNYNNNKCCGQLHTPSFNPNEEAIETGISIIAHLALSLKPQK